MSLRDCSRSIATQRLWQHRRWSTRLPGAETPLSECHLAAPARPAEGLPLAAIRLVEFRVSQGPVGSTCWENQAELLLTGRPGQTVFLPSRRAWLFGRR